MVLSWIGYPEAAGSSLSNRYSPGRRCKFHHGGLGQPKSTSRSQKFIIAPASARFDMLPPSNGFWTKPYYCCIEQQNLSAHQKEVLTEVRQSDPMLAGRKVLVVDDDVRNIFALTSVLEQQRAQDAARGKRPRGNRAAAEYADVDIVLMDIMMPDMDGYETMRAIRGIPEFQNLPIIALTAKAMKGDREKCLRAGASDYVTKPVDLDLLFSVMRVWMARDMDNKFEHGVAPCRIGWRITKLRLDDDRNKIQSGDSVLLIVEDDPTFARILVDRAHQGLKALVALRGAHGAYAGADVQAHAITLDVRLPDMSGWTVLDHLKHDPATRHIPVHVISGRD